MSEGVYLSDGARGYERSDRLQEDFVAAAARLLEVDGWANPSRGGARELRADLALEGGGVKGIALVGAVMVLDEAGYRFHRVAGTSAGAVTASVIAGIVKAGHDMTTLLAALRSLDFRKFMPDGRLHDVMGRTAGHFASIVADAAILTNREGI
ncbi:MAG: patatin-like phospholipase family protein [Acidimicrobiales bacterium]